MTNRFFKVFLLCAILSLSCLSIISCGIKHEKSNNRSINLAFQNWIGYGLFYLAQDKGFCGEEGIRINFIDEEIDANRLEAFNEGMLDCEAGTIDLLVAKVSKGADIEAVMGIDYSFGSDAIVADRSIRKIEDLIGKRVAFAKGDVGETFLSMVLIKNGLSLDKVNIVPVMADDAANVFLRGEAEACVTWQPQVSRALGRPFSYILASTKDYPDVIIDTLNARKAFARENPELIKKLMRAWFRALTYYKKYPDISNAIISKYYDITPEEYAKQTEGLRWIGYDEQKDPDIFRKWQMLFKDIADVKLNSGAINVPPETAKFSNHSFLKSLYEDSK